MKRRKTSNIFSIIFYIIIICICIKLFNVYKTLYFNGFVKGEYTSGLTEFTRDNEVKYGENRSYKMYSQKFNDAMFYKEIEVSPNTVYKVSCMVKTEDVEAEKENSEAGAIISLAEESEVSESIRGTNDWQELTMTFNSKAREKVKIGFRLGGNDSNARGTVWFSNLKLEEGITNQDTNWKMGCFILKNIDVIIDGEQYKFSMSSKDIENLKSNIVRFEKACSQLSENKMTAECDIIELDDPITTISYEEEHKYYIGAQDIRQKIGKYVLEKEYDYIFVAVRMGNETKAIPTQEWIGLGGMKLYDIGYSVIRMPNEESNYIYIYDSGINRFPEEVFIHEFLHTLERNMNEYKYDIPELHSYEEHGYKEENLTNLKEWYKDYMRCKILDEKTGEYIGLNEIVYSLKPAQNSNFKYAVEIELDEEPQNIIEEIKLIISILSNVKEG